KWVEFERSSSYSSSDNRIRSVQALQRTYVYGVSSPDALGTYSAELRQEGNAPRSPLFRRGWCVGHMGRAEHSCGRGGCAAASSPTPRKGSWVRGAGLGLW